MRQGFFIYFDAMKKLLLVLLALVVIGAAAAAFVFLGPATGFSGGKEYLYIRTKAATKEAVLDSMKKNELMTRDWAFNLLAKKYGYWSNIKPGRYEIKNGASVVDIFRMLKNGTQSPVSFTFNKLRTKKDLARMAGRRLEFDSTEMMAFLNNADSMARYNATPETALWNLLPDTYEYFWNTTPSKVYSKLAGESKKFWNEERKQKAAALNLTPIQVYIIGSIVEEETNAQQEKDTIASVYINRLRRGMPLGADPTIKFALQDFSINWIRGDMLNVSSPYNTYRNKGLPPGPICTPSRKTLDAVLSAPATNYLYFVANSNFSGTHLFSATYAEHLEKARAFQQEDKRRREAKANASEAN